MQTLSLSILLGWSTRMKVYLLISSKPSGAEELKYDSDKHTKLCLYIEIYSFNCVSFEKLWTGKILWF